MEVVRLQQGLELAPLENGPPGAFRIFPFGKIETTKGVFRFDEEAARRVIAAWRDYGFQIPEGTFGTYQPEVVTVRTGGVSNPGRNVWDP